MLYLNSINRLKEAYASGHKECIVAYSAGKDSVTVYDLCAQVFDRVHAFFLYIHPDLRVEQDAIEKAERRFGMKVHQFPNISLIDMLRAGYFMHHTVDEIYRALRYDDIYTVIRDRCGCRLIAQGHRMDESLQRRGMISASKGWDKKLGKLYPLADWNAKTVYGYLRHRKLLPFVIKTFGTDTSGVSLGTNSLAWLKREHPDDFEKITSMFPRAQQKLLREELRRKAGMRASEKSA